MSTLSTFFPGGGGTPINGLASLYKESLSDGVFANVVTTESGEVYLKTGVLETNTALYPDAATSFEPVTFQGTFDLNALTGGSDFQGIDYDGTNLWVLSNGNNNVYPITTGTTPTNAGTAVAVTARTWRGVGVNSSSTELVVMANDGNWERYNSSTGAAIDSGVISPGYQQEWRGFGGWDGTSYYGVTWSNFAGSDRAGTFSSLGNMTGGTALTALSIGYNYTASIGQYNGAIYVSGGAGIQKFSNTANDYSAFNRISNGGNALAIDGTYMYVVSGNTLYIYNMANVVGIPCKLSTSIFNYGSGGEAYGVRLATTVPLYVRVK